MNFISFSFVKVGTGTSIFGGAITTSAADVPKTTPTASSPSASDPSSIFKGFNICKPTVAESPIGKFSMSFRKFFFHSFSFPEQPVKVYSVALHLPHCQAMQQHLQPAQHQFSVPVRQMLHHRQSVHRIVFSVVNRW